MPEIKPDLSDSNRCISVHWTLPVQCVLPSSHRENWHEAWHPQNGNRLRYRRSMGGYATEELNDGWHDLQIPPPGGFCNDQFSGHFADKIVRCTGQYGHGWNHRAVVDGCTYSWNTPIPKGLTVDQLTRDVKQLRGMLVAAHSRIADLDRVRANRDYWRNRYRSEARTTWSTAVPPGGEVCADCGEPVESEPCAEHNPTAVAEQLRAEVEQWRATYGADALPGALARLKKAEDERDEARAELARYVGHEPTIAEEMAYLSRCLDAVHALCDEAGAKGIASGGTFTVDAVRQAADGIGHTPANRPALPWAQLMDDEDLAEFLAELEHAIATPGATPDEALAAVEKACSTWRLIAEAQHAHNTAPGPNAEAGDGR